MRNRAKKIVALFFSVVFGAGCCACGSKAPAPPEGYAREHGENMFWEKEDTPEDGYILQNTDIQIYNYCPSVLQEDENTRYVYYCSNRYSTGETKQFEWSGVSPNQQGSYTDFVNEVGDNTITDYIAYRKGVKVGGEWYWSEKQYVLSPTPGSLTEWEQVCDPNVVKGEFSYNGEQYSYLMAYLACATRDNTYNHVCLAVANSPAGPWKKCEDINPLIRYSSEGVPDIIKENTYLWGYGQASMINLDKKGDVLMFYSSICPVQNQSSGAWGHATDTTVTRFDLSDLNDVKIKSSVRGISADGLTNADGTSLSSLTNGDYAFDPSTNRIYLIGDGGFVAYVENRSLQAAPNVGDVFFDYAGRWKEENIAWTTVAHLQANYPRTYSRLHNNCIIRDAYGYIPDGKRLEFAVTGALPDGGYKQIFPAATQHIWTYRILRKTLDIV